MPKQSILVVDDEEDIRELLSYNLQREGFDVQTAVDGETAVELVNKEPPDLVVLDLMLPGIDGYDVCYKLKSNPDLNHVPIIMLTAKGEESDEVIGFGIGADDYVTKPFSPKVLVARINAVLRRRAEPEEPEPDEEPVIARGGLSINPNRHEVLLEGKEIRLTPIEFKVLYFLSKTPGRVYTRKRIIDKAQGEDVYITERTVDVHVVALRRKLGDQAHLIETVRGVGYKFKG